MKFEQNMNLYSPSGYAMPFELTENEEPNITLQYGEQIHPETGNEFFHHGIDFQVRPGTWLKALATGVVSGINSDPIKGYFVTVTYPNYNDNNRFAYEVVYSHISESLVSFGKNLKAGDNIARCEGLLHIEVKYNGKEVDPLDFLVMIRDNLVMQAQTKMSGNNPEIATMDMDVHTKYDDRQPEVDHLMTRFLPKYLLDIFKGNYHVPQATEQSLRSHITEGARQGLYYEQIPSMMNPLGLGRSSINLISIIQTLLIEDFLNYLGCKHSIFLNGTTEEEKKKFMTGM